MAGIVSYGAYVPIYRLQAGDIGKVWGSRQGKGEKAVANCDEDSLTMGVEAARDCLQGIDRDRVDGLYFASTTPPYREKQAASIIRAVLDLPKEVFTLDITDSLRAGSNALRAAIDAVGSGSARNVLVVAGDCRLPAPNSAFESLFGDGAAALLVGDADVAVNVEAMHTVSSEFIDVWRRESDRYPRTWEERFVLTHGYEEVLGEATLAMMKARGLSPEEVGRAVFSAPNPRSHMAMAKKLGFDYQTQVQDPMLGMMGHTGAAQGLMMLVSAMEKAESGEKILFSNYGDGCDSFLLGVTGDVKRIAGKRGIQKHLASKMQLPSYGKYLQYKNLLEWEAERLPPEYSSLNIHWRDRKQIMALIANRCKACGKVQIDFPVQRVCAWCQAKDDFDEVRLSDQKGTLFSFSMDERTRDLDLPSVMSVVDFDDGARFTTVMTDRDPEKIDVGMPVEMTFRKFHEGQGIHNYFWKCRPVRG